MSAHSGRTVEEETTLLAQSSYPLPFCFNLPVNSLHLLSLDCSAFCQHLALLINSVNSYSAFSVCFWVPHITANLNRELFLLSLTGLMETLIKKKFKLMFYLIPEKWGNISEKCKICIFISAETPPVASFNFDTRYSVTFKLHHIHRSTSSAVSLLLITLRWDILSSTSASVATLSY